MKRLFLISCFGLGLLFNSLPAQTLGPTFTPTEHQFKQLIFDVIGGNLAALGPQQADELKQFMSNHAKEADRYVENELSDGVVHPMGISSFDIIALLNITKENDPEGALKVAFLFRDRLKSELADIESGKVTVDENDRENRKSRLLRNINYANDFIDQANHVVPPSADSPQFISSTPPPPIPAPATPVPAPQVQPANETSIPLWIYGIPILSLGCIVGIWFLFLREKKN